MQDMRIENSPIHTPTSPISTPQPIHRSTVFSSSIESKDQSCLGGIWSTFTSFISSIWHALLRCFGRAEKGPDGNTGINAADKEENNKASPREKEIKEFVDVQLRNLQGHLDNVWNAVWIERGSDRVLPHSGLYKPGLENEITKNITNESLANQGKAIKIVLIWVYFDQENKQLILQEYHRNEHGFMSAVGNSFTRHYQTDSILEAVNSMFGPAVPPHFRQELKNFVGSYQGKLSKEGYIDPSNLDF